MKKIFKLLDFEDKKELYLIIFFLVNLSLLEILTLYFLQDIISYFTNFKNDIKLINHNNTSFVLKNVHINIIIFIFILIFSTRCFLSIFINYKKNKLVKNINDKLSLNIYKNYLNQKFEFFLNNNSSSIISSLLIEIDKFAYRVIDSFLIFFVEIFIVSGVILFLIYNYFQASVFLFTIILIFIILFYYVFRKKFLKSGNEKLIFDREKLENLQNSLFLIQNIKLDNLENEFANQFFQKTKLASKAQFFSNFMLDAIKPVIEILVLFFFIMILGFFMFYLEFPKQEIIIILSLFLVGMFRILPSCNRILNCFNSFKYYKSTINLLETKLNILKNEKFNNDVHLKDQFKDELKFEDSIEFRNVTFEYSQNKKTSEILSNINFKILKNDLIGIYGDSGSGKTTFLNIFCYLLKPKTGDIFLDSINIKNNFLSYQKKIGYVSQHTYLTDGTILDNITFGSKKNKCDFNTLNKVMKLSLVNEFVEKLRSGINHEIGERGIKLSGGQKQRLTIARALYKNPEILILDEATNALDQNSEKLILNNLKESKNYTIILVSHNIKNLQICDSIYKVENKNLIKI